MFFIEEFKQFSGCFYLFIFFFAKISTFLKLIDIRFTPYSVYHFSVDAGDSKCAFEEALCYCMAEILQMPDLTPTNEPKQL